MFGLKLDFKHGRKLTPGEFNHFIDRPEYVDMIRNRLIIRAGEMSEFEERAVLKRVEEWLYENSSDIYFVKFERGLCEDDHRIEIYLLDKNDAFSMKLALQGTEVEYRGW